MHASKTKVKDGHQFEIILNVNFNTATVEVEDLETHEKWESTFDANFVEELTRKVGSFKKFPVFISMLESAVKETSSSVSVQLLNYSELELLRNKKFGLQTSLQCLQSPSQTLHERKFLILHHVGEFDRTRYPLALNYLGVLDVKLLQEKLKKVQLELATYRNQNLTIGQNREINNLKKEVERLKKEKSEIEAEFEEFKKALERKDKGRKESHKLRNFINNMEKDLMNEVLRHRSSVGKKLLENKTLTAEVKKLKASEFRLRTQVQTLKNEVFQLKRVSSRSSLPERSRDSSLESRVSRRSCRSQQIYSRNCRRDLGPLMKVRSLSDDPSKSSPFGQNRKSSPAAGHRSRFDPTAYVLERKNKLLEIQRKRESSIESRRSRFSPDNGRKRFHSEATQSSAESCTSVQQKRNSANSRMYRSSIQAELETEASDAEPAVTDIDLRLERLKQFVKELL